MKIKDLFKNIKVKCYITILLSLSCIIMTAITINSTQNYNLFSFCYPAENVFHYVTGIFIHGIPEMLNMSISHLIFNLVMLIFWGVLVEKTLGNSKFCIITLSAWFLNSLAIQISGVMITPEGESIRGAGISLICYMYATIGIYILFRIFKSDKKLIFKQFFTYVYLNLIIALLSMFNPFVAGMASFLIHLLGVIIGISFIFIYKNKIKKNIELIELNERQSIK